MRDLGVSCELYPNATKMQKQMKYATNKNIAHVVMIGESELDSKTFVAKNMETGEQLTYSVDETEKFIESLA